MEKTRGTYDSQIAEKANTPLARWLQDRATNPKALAEYLGVSVQAVNQYKQGTAFPKTENLIKIAEFYGISVDYLLGRTSIPNMDANMQAVHRMTGLSVEAISKLSEMKYDGNQVFLDVISLLIEDGNAEYFLALLCGSISTAHKKMDSSFIDLEIDGIPARMAQSTLINTVLQTKFIENLSSIASAYWQSYTESPDKRMKKKGGK